MTVRAFDSVKMWQCERDWQYDHVTKRFQTYFQKKKIAEKIQRFSCKRVRCADFICKNSVWYENRSFDRRRLSSERNKRDVWWFVGQLNSIGLQHLHHDQNNDIVPYATGPLKDRYRHNIQLLWERNRWHKGWQQEKCRSCCIQIFGISLTHIFPSHPRRLATPPPQEPTVHYRYQMVTQYSIVCIVCIVL